MINENRLFSDVVRSFGSKSRIIEEAVENAMRVKATKVKIELNNELTKLSISNDGPLLNDFSSLLILA